MAKIYGYARVSTKEQNEDRQIIALSEYGVPSKNVFLDKSSGKDFNRDNYRRMIKKFKKGDILVIKSIDRLGHNYEEIIEQWRHITKEIGADIKVIDLPILDTTQYKDLLGTFIADLTLNLLSFVAENERTAIKQRQAEGIAAAKAKGVKFGRRPMKRPSDYEKVCSEWKQGNLSAREAARKLNISPQTFLNWTKKTVKNSTLYLTRLENLGMQKNDI